MAAKEISVKKYVVRLSGEGACAMSWSTAFAAGAGARRLKLHIGGLCTGVLSLHHSKRADDFPAAGAILHGNKPGTLARTSCPNARMRHRPPRESAPCPL
jgi:hypothetical protein